MGRAPQSSPDTDGYLEPLDPPTAWISIEPLDASVSSDGSRLQASRVTMRYHPQVTVDVCLRYADPVLLRNRDLFVKGVQNVSDGNAELVLFCEEVIP